VVFGLSFQIELAFYAAATLSLLACLVLLLTAWRSDSQPYNRTELWLLLSPDERPDAHVAQFVISSALRSARLKFAVHAAASSAALFTASLLSTFVARFQ
jgi:hypothetical protein